MKKTLKQFVFEKMDEHGFCLDQEVCDFIGSYDALCTAYEYKEQWKRLVRDRIFFGDKEVIGVTIFGHKRKTYAIKTSNGTYKCCKDFYNETKQKFKKVFPKKKYFYNGFELYNVQEIEDNFLGHELMANYNDGDGEKLGKFYLKQLTII